MISVDDHDIKCRVLDGWVLEHSEDDAPSYLFGGQELDVDAERARDLIAIGVLEPA
jgi:hypothetical protein